MALAVSFLFDNKDDDETESRNEAIMSHAFERYKNKNDELKKILKISSKLNLKKSSKWKFPSLRSNLSNQNKNPNRLPLKSSIYLEDN